MLKFTSVMIFERNLSLYRVLKLNFTGRAFSEKIHFDLVDVFLSVLHLAELFLRHRSRLPAIAPAFDLINYGNECVKSRST